MKATTKRPKTKTARDLMSEARHDAIEAAFAEVDAHRFTSAQRAEVFVELAHWMLHEAGVALESARGDRERKVA